MKIIKRSGVEVDFDKNKIFNAIKKANDTVISSEKMSEEQIWQIASDIEVAVENSRRALSVEEIQDMVENQIMNQRAFEVARHYITYRYRRELSRKKNSTDDAILALVEYENEEIKQENSNKDPKIAPTQRDYIAGEVSKDLTWRVLLPDEVVNAHQSGEAHFHDADYYAQHIHNCDLINLEDMLQNGTVISGVQITKPRSLSTAANLTCQIITQVASSQYGGQTFSLAHLAPFVNISRQRIREHLSEEFSEMGITPDKGKFDEMVEKELKREIAASIQTIQYQLVTMMTTNGQTPFVSMFMYLDEAEEGRERDDLALLMEEVLKQRYKGLPNEKGHWVTAAFPKLLYVLDEDNIHEDSKYYYLTELASKVTAKRMVPDYISAKKMRELKGETYACMGCRSFLTPDRFTDNGVGNIAKALNYKEGKHKYYGRFNQGVYTLNLPDIACASEGDMTKFWKIFEERLNTAHKALRCRHERLKGTPSDVAPILWQYGALARLEKGETIDKLLYDGYSTLSLGYAGLYECCMRMTGKSHTDPVSNGDLRAEFSANCFRRFLRSDCAVGAAAA